MLAAHMHFSPEEVDRVRRYWGAPRIITGEGMKAVALFEAIGRGKIKALWVMGTNPLVSMPRADAIREALDRPRPLRGVRGGGGFRHRPGPRQDHRAAARPGLGREGRHGHQFRAADLAPAPLPREPRRGPARLGGAVGGRPPARPRPGLRVRLRRRDLPRACRALGLREQRHPRLRPRRADRPQRRRLRREPAGAVADPEALRPPGGAAGQGAAVRRRAVLHLRPARALRRGAAAGPRAGGLGGVSPRAQHRPGARPLAHDDAHREEPAPLGAPGRPVRRGASGRRGGPRASRRAASPGSRPSTARPSWR